MENQQTVLVPDENKLAAKEADAMAYATALVISSNETFTLADRFCVTLKGLENEIISDFAESKKTVALAHKKICAQEKAHLDKVIPPRTMIKQKMSVWQDKQERLRREEEDRQRLEAQKAAEAEALRQAELAQALGNTEEAEAIIQEPVYVAPVVVAPTTPKASTVIRKMWTFRITNPALVPDQYKIIDESKLRKQAAATGNSIAVPGVEFYQKPV